MTANRENARKSTGPRTEEGKARSRQNARKHGLAGEGFVIPEDEAAMVERRLAEWRPGLPGASSSPRHAWLAERLVAESIRFERAHDMERAVLGQIAHRAASSWDDDRRLAAEEMAGRLASDPPLVLLRLRQTPQGCTLLAERWDALARIADAGAAWDDAQRQEALDLLGRPPELRSLPLLDDGEADGPASCLALAQREADALRQRAEDLSELDDHERAGAELGLAIERPDGFGRSGSGDLRRALGLARRYLAAAWRRFRWAWDELDRATRDARRASPSDAPAPTPRPKPAARPRPRPREAASLLGLLGSFSAATELTADAFADFTLPEPTHVPTPELVATASPAARPALAGRPLGSWLSTGSGRGNRRQRRARAGGA